jgi:ABC-2 type transport system permease protein
VISKYYSTPKGESIYVNKAGDSLTFTLPDKKKPIKSVPLDDYIEVGVFGKRDPNTDAREILYLKKHKVNEIKNEFVIEVDKKPEEAGVDPFNKLIDRNSRDNRTVVKEMDDSSSKNSKG